MMIDPEKKNQIYHGGTERTEFTQSNKPFVFFLCLCASLVKTNFTPRTNYAA